LAAAAFSATLVGFAMLLPAGLRSLVGEEPKAAAKKSDAKQDGDIDESHFLRVLRDGKGTPTSMQTAIARYVGTDGKYKGVTVDLIGAVHIGEPGYYEKLNQRFTQYEAMLYELVAPKGTKIPKGGRERSSHPLGMMQHGMSDALGLVHQMNYVDYTKKNFVHADMTPDEFSESMKKLNESWVSMAFKAIGQGIAQQSNNPNSHPELEMLAALFGKDPETGMKRALARQFEDMEGALDVFGGKEGSTIIHERNKKALEVLRKQLAKGKTNVAIFYGAAHLPDMHAHLLADFGLKATTTEWLTAWDMTDAAKRVEEAEKSADKQTADDKKPADAKPTRKKRARPTK
jgi:hypothetical protein